MDNDIIYVLVAVYGAEDETAAEAAIDNLTNDEQVFTSIQTKVVEPPEQFDDEPVIYFP